MDDMDELDYMEQMKSMWQKTPKKPIAVFYCWKTTKNTVPVSPAPK